MKAIIRAHLLYHSVDLGMSQNALNGTFPTEITALSALGKTLYFLATLYHSFGTLLTWCIVSEQLNLHETGLVGMIPGNLANISSLSKLHPSLAHVRYFTVGPANIFEELLNLAKNELTGTFMERIGLLTSISECLCHQNSLVISLSNTFAGALSERLTEELHLYENKLNGTITDDISRLTNMSELFVKH